MQSNSMQAIFRFEFYTGNVLDTDRRNSEPKNRSPVAPPGTSAIIINSNVIICTTAHTIVNPVLCTNIAKYSVARRLPAYVPESISLGRENACLINIKNPLRKQKLKSENVQYNTIFIIDVIRYGCNAMMQSFTSK